MVMMAHGRERAMSEVEFDAFIAQAPKYPRTIKDTITHKLLWRKKNDFNLFKRRKSK